MNSIRSSVSDFLEEYAPFLSTHGTVLLPLVGIILAGWLTLKLFRYLEHEDNYKPLNDGDKRTKSKRAADDSDESSDPMDGRDGRDVSDDDAPLDYGADTPQVRYPCSMQTC